MKKEGKVYLKDIERPCSLFDVKAWYLGESTELEKWLGVGFHNTIFAVKNQNVTIYYDKNEVKKFDKAMEEKFSEEFFDNICEHFFQLIEQSKATSSDEEIFKIAVKSWPSLTIFDEASKYPEYLSDTMLKRLIRIRSSTESFSYDLVKNIKKFSEPEEYIFYKGEIISKSLEEFTKENNIIIN